MVHSLEASREESFVLRHRKGILLFVALLVSGVFAWGYRHWAERNAQGLAADEAYRFEQGPFKSLKEKPEELPSFLEAFKVLAQEHGPRGRVVLLGVEIADYLRGEGRRREALEVLEAIDREGGERLERYLVGVRRAALWEEVGEASRALVILEDLVAQGHIFWEEKIYLNLGRLYLDGGEREKARAHFLHIVDREDEGEFDGDILKTARLYLEEIDRE